jgi:hypothetical protein
MTDTLAAISDSDVTQGWLERQLIRPQRRRREGEWVTCVYPLDVPGVGFEPTLHVSGRGLEGSELVLCSCIEPQPTTPS